MNILLSMLKKLPEYEALLSALEARQTVAVSGVSQIIRSHFISALIAESERPALIVCQDDLAAQRVQADFDNYRKRNASLRTEVADDTVRETIKEILPSLDNLERALDAAKKAGEEGSLLTAWYGPVVLELYGAGATDYVLSSGGVKDGDAGFYYAPIAALRDLPEGLGMRQAQAETLALAPADAEWVLVYPNDFSEVPQP